MLSLHTDVDYSAYNLQCQIIQQLIIGVVILGSLGRASGKKHRALFILLLPDRIHPWVLIITDDRPRILGF